MARPARPVPEGEAVSAAAATLPGSIQAKARAVAAQVVAELMRDLERSDDPMMLALAELEQRTNPGPVVRLATCPEIDTASEFIERRVGRLRARGGRYLGASDQLTEKRSIAGEIETALAGRYARHLRTR